MADEPDQNGQEERLRALVEQLSDVLTEDLFAVIKSRVDHVIFAWALERGPNCTERFRCWKGDFTECCLLTRLLEKDVLEGYERAQRVDGSTEEDGETR